MKILNLSYPLYTQQAMELRRVLKADGIERVGNFQLTGSLEQARELCQALDWQPDVIVMPEQWQSELSEAAMFVWVNMGEPPVFVLDDDAIVQVGG